MGCPLIFHLKCSLFISYSHKVAVRDGFIRIIKMHLRWSFDHVSILLL